ncbi:MAG: methyltransferase domain-containing protein [bacterium]|nr:methyltransferase domain-containing protein [bacterium]
MPRSVEQHYIVPDLVDKILQALAASGKDIEHLNPKDLAPVDEFHLMGRQATEELAGLANLRPGLRVLDIGAGLGGASRYLASRYGCRVTGIDMTQQFCLLATDLARRTGLSSRVVYRWADALEIPLPKFSFDRVWSQHMMMNIADKSKLYSEIRRVLAPGGSLVMHEIIARDGGAVIFPVPWAPDPSISFLPSVSETQKGLEAAGFRTTEWRDVTEAAAEWLGGQLEGTNGGPPPAIGIHLLIGPEFPTIMSNVLRNLRENRIAVIQAVMEPTSH